MTTDQSAFEELARDRGWDVDCPSDMKIFEEIFMLGIAHERDWARGLVEALLGIEKGGTAVLIDAALDEPASPVNPDVLLEIVKSVRKALATYEGVL